MSHRDSVVDFYERNTRWFVRVGRSRDAGGIHRELWGEGVEDAVEAVLYANRRIARHLPDGVAVPRIVDLGCGIGGSLCWLLERHAGVGVGLTISGAQVRLATERAASRGLSDRCSFVRGDFTDPPALGTFGLAFAIEAFVHSPEPEAFFAGAARLVERGGTLVIIDDFLAPSVSATERVVSRFRQGWHATALCTVDEAIRVARLEGFDVVADEDLTPLVAIGRLRDHWVAFWVAALSWAQIRHPYWRSLVGGDALQTCLRRGLVTYRQLTFRRR